MSAAQPTLDTLFQFRESQAGDPTDAEPLESTESMTEMKEALRRASPRHSWTATSNELQSQIGALLDVGLMDILVRAWNENKLFEKLLHPDRYDPEESFLISLKKHTVTSKHKPYIDVTLNGKSLGRIDFQIDLALTLEGVIVKIKGARIHEVRLGTVQGSGTLKCEGLILLTRKTENMKLPHFYRFKEPSSGRP